MAKANKICKKFIIVCGGKDDSDIEQAFDEAGRCVKEGYFTGHDSNDTGAFYFAVIDDVPKNDWPAGI